MPIQTPAYNGMSQDLFYGDTGECAYMENISTDQMRYEELSTTYILISWGSLGVTDTITHMSETPAGLVSCWNSRVFLEGWDKSATVAGATRSEYAISTAWVLSHYFFTNASIIKTDSTITSASAPVVKAAWLTTATCNVRDTILFTVGSIVYAYNTTTGTIATVLSTMKTWVTVKHMYFYNDMLVILTTFWNDTIIYQAQFDGTTYLLYSTEVKQGVTAISAVWDSGTLYWITSNRIFGFNGGVSQEIRFVGYASDFTEWFIGWSLAFKDGDLYIGYGTYIYIWWAKHAGRRNSFTKKTIPQGTIEWITGSYIHLKNSTNYIYTNSSKFPNTGYTISLPYDASIYGMEKTDLAIRVGYQLPSTTSIELYAQTDTMDMAGNSWIKIADITDTTKRNQYIGVSEINTLLWDANWQYIRFKRVFTSAWWSSWLRDYSPKFFDLEFIHSYTNERLKSA